MFSLSLLATVTLAVSAAASPIVIREPLVSLPLAKRFNFTGTARLVEHDKARASGLKAYGTARKLGTRQDAVISVPAVNEVMNYALAVSSSLVYITLV